MGSLLGCGSNTRGCPSASLQLGRSSSAGDCLQDPPAGLNVGVGPGSCSVLTTHAGLRGTAGDSGMVSTEADTIRSYYSVTISHLGAAKNILLCRSGGSSQETAMGHSKGSSCTWRSLRTIQGVHSGVDFRRPLVRRPCCACGVLSTASPCPQASWQPSSAHRCIREVSLFSAPTL